MDGRYGDDAREVDAGGGGVFVLEADRGLDAVDDAGDAGDADDGGVGGLGVVVVHARSVGESFVVVGGGVAQLLGEDLDVEGSSGSIRQDPNREHAQVHSRSFSITRRETA